MTCGINPESVAWARKYLYDFGPHQKLDEKIFTFSLGTYSLNELRKLSETGGPEWEEFVRVYNRARPERKKDGIDEIVVELD